MPIECIVTYAGNTLTNHNFCHSVFPVNPGWHRDRGPVVKHNTTAIDDQPTVTHKGPVGILTADTHRDLRIHLRSHTGGIVFRRHGILVMKFQSIILQIAVVTQEIPGVSQEEVVFPHSRVPGGVHVVVKSIQLHNIPAMGAATVTGNHSAVDIQLQHQPIEQRCITLADCGLIHQRRIGGELQQIRPILQICVIIGDVLAHVIINRPDLLIVRFAAEVQIPDQLVHSGGELCLLLGGGIVGNRKCIAESILSVLVAAVDLCTCGANVPQQVVTLCRISGMANSLIKHAIKQSL